MGNENRVLWWVIISTALLITCFFVASVEWFNKVVSHPIVSGLLIAVVVSIYLPKRTEAERRRSLLKGFYGDVEFIAKRYELIGTLIVDCAMKPSCQDSAALGPVTHGNEPLSASRLNQELQLTQQQKLALLNTEAAINVINIVLQVNLDRFNEYVSLGLPGIHSDANMKTAFDSVCNICFTLRRMIEHKERFVIDSEPDDYHRIPAIQLIYPDDKEKRELVLKWLENDDAILTLLKLP